MKTLDIINLLKVLKIKARDTHEHAQVVKSVEALSQNCFNALNFSISLTEAYAFYFNAIIILHFVTPGICTLRIRFDNVVNVTAN